MLETVLAAIQARQAPDLRFRNDREFADAIAHKDARMERRWIRGEHQPTSTWRNLSTTGFSNTSYPS
ncbi:MAG: hypothetical protein JSR61_13780 [Proteobacteria bacterium]|nr:hypothetical protein [Pseudomonadota bacterium]